MRDRILEVALPDAAKAAQRTKLEEKDAKKRGGEGRRKAKAAETEEGAAVHVEFVEEKQDEDNVRSDHRMIERMLDPATGAEFVYKSAEDLAADDDLIRLIRQNLPDTPARYFHARMLTDSQREAAKSVGIDPRTARKYEQLYAKELRLLISGGRAR